MRQVARVEMRKAVEKEADSEDQKCPTNGMGQQGTPRFALFLPICDRIDHGDAHNEQKEGENQVVGVHPFHSACSRGHKCGPSRRHC